MAIPFNTLMEEAKCYLCLGISQAQAMELALLNRIAEGGGVSDGVLVYRAILTQSGTNAPVATILENTLGGTPVWTRADVGNYIATLTGAFPAGKTFVLHNTVATTSLYAADRVSADAIELTVNTFSVNFGTEDAAWTGVDDALGNFFCIQILVYP